MICDNKCSTLSSVFVAYHCALVQAPYLRITLATPTASIQYRPFAHNRRKYMIY